MKNFRRLSGIAAAEEWSGVSNSTNKATMRTPVSSRCFESGLVAEVCGSENHVLKLLPALTSEREHP